MATFLVWIFLIQTFAGTISLVEGYTCWYDDTYNIRHYVYCSYSDCCGTSSYRYCCNYTSPGAIVGAVLGSLVFIAIIVSIITCCCCACCPAYQYRTQGTVISTVHPGTNYQTIPSTAPYPPNTDPYAAKPAGAYTAPPPYQV